MNEDELFATDDGIVWIPSESSNIQLRFLIIAHCGSAGHRGQHATNGALASRFYWKDMRKDVDEFLRQCLHCLPGSGGDIVPRPFGATARPTFTNEIIDFDYLYLGKSYCTFKYLWVVRDRLSGFVDVFPSAEPTAGHTAESLMEWFSPYGVAKCWVTDLGSHFVNRVIDDLALKLHAQHHFNLAYCPWTDGGVETANRHILQAMRSLLSEFRLSTSDWPT